MMPTGGDYLMKMLGDKPMNRYRTTLRPPAFGGLPKDVGWKYIEVPPDGTHYAPNLPVSNYHYGVIETDRPLTFAELDHFDIERVPISGDELRALMSGRGLTNEALASITGNHMTAISRYRRGTLAVPMYVEVILNQLKELDNLREEIAILREQKRNGWRQAAE